MMLCEWGEEFERCRKLELVGAWKWAKNFYDEVTASEILATGFWGNLWTSDIHVSSRMKNPLDEIG